MAVDKNFVVKNGLEVSTNLLYGDAVRAKVGIGTTFPQHKLHVIGDVKAESQIITGISSLNNVSIGGYVSAGGTVGNNKQFLISTGTGIAWTTAPNLRVVQTTVANEGDTQFNFAHTLGLIDVYVNGVKLSTYDYLETDTYIQLTTPCFAGDIVELIGYYTYQNIGAAYTGGISGLTILDEGTIIGAPSAVTSLNFVGGQVVAAGTGAGVTVYVGDGAGIGIGSSGVLVGTGFTTLNFIGVGNTFKVNGSTIDISINSGDTNYWLKGPSGIHTSSRVGIGSTLPVAGADLDVRGIIKTDTFFASPKKIDRNVDTLANYNNFAVGAVAVEGGSAITVVPDSTLTLFGGPGSTYINAETTWIRSSAGIHTTFNVGIGTTNPRYNLEVGAVGSASTSLWVNGNARVTGILTVGSSSIVLDGYTDRITADKVTGVHDPDVLVGDHGNITDSSVDAFGINVESKLDLSRDPAGGVKIVDLGTIGDTSFDAVEWAKTSVGIHTLSNVGVGTTNPTSALTVKGNTSLETLNVSGVSTIVGDGINAYQYFTSTNAYLDFASTFNVKKGGTTYISVSGNTVALGENTTVNAAYWRVRTLPTGAEINGILQVGNDITVTGTTVTNQLSVSGVSTFIDTRLASVSEKSTIVSGNTVSLVYNTGGGNVAICTNPTGPITLNVTGIPTDSSFDNRTISFTVVAIQTATGYACTTVNLNGVSRTVRFPGGVVSVASTSSYDIFNFTGINTVGSGSTTANYQVLGLLNGNFK